MALPSMWVDNLGDRPASISDPKGWAVAPPTSQMEGGFRKGGLAPPCIAGGASTAADHADDLDHVAVAQRAAGVRVALQDLAVDLDGDGPGIDAQVAQVVQQRGRPGELDRLAVHADADHRLKYPMAAKP